MFVVGSGGMGGIDVFAAAALVVVLFGLPFVKAHISHFSTWPATMSRPRCSMILCGIQVFPVLSNRFGRNMA